MNDICLVDDMNTLASYYKSIELCLHAAESVSSPSMRSLQATLRIIDSQYKSLQSKYSKHLSSPRKQQSSVSTNDRIESATTTDFSVDDNLTSTSQTPSPLKASNRLVSDSSTVKKNSWIVPKFIKPNRLARRYSGDLGEYLCRFKQRNRENKERLRRRKSFSEETIENAAWQEMQISQIKHSTSQPHIFEQRVYRRCRSARIVEDAIDWETSIKILRRSSLLSSRYLTYGNGEVWPESITSLLTGGQTLIDRYLLFDHIESVFAKVNRNINQTIHRVLTERRTCLKLWSAGISIPQPDKKWGGEDAFFICDESDGFVGVADGVGEWGELGCNPKQFAEELMEGARQEALALKYGLDSPKAKTMQAGARAKRVLRAGFYATKSFGASTAIIAGLNSQGDMLGIANIGDSTCLLLRRDPKRHRRFVLYRRTKEQQHFFNCPYQLTRIPRKEELAGLASTGMHDLARTLSNFSGGLVGDTPDMADLYDVQVQEGDILITASDGVLDNLFDQEITTLVSLTISTYESRILENDVKKNDFLPHPFSILPPRFHPQYGLATPPKDIARAIARAALYRSLHPRTQVPFSLQSRRACGYHQGGKADDITVVVSWIT